MKKISFLLLQSSFHGGREHLVKLKKWLRRERRKSKKWNDPKEVLQKRNMNLWKNIVVRSEQRLKESLALNMHRGMMCQIFVNNVKSYKLCMMKKRRYGNPFKVKLYSSYDHWLHWVWLKKDQNGILDEINGQKYLHQLQMMLWLTQKHFVLNWPILWPESRILHCKTNSSELFRHYSTINQQNVLKYWLKTKKKHISKHWKKRKIILLMNDMHFFMLNLLRIYTNHLMKSLHCIIEILIYQTNQHLINISRKWQCRRFRSIDNIMKHVNIN